MPLHTSKPYRFLPALPEVSAAVVLLCPCRLVEKYGEGQWSLISTFFPGRIGKQCRERWHHQLNPKINRNAWSVEEERIIVAAHKVAAGTQAYARTVLLLFSVLLYCYCYSLH